MTLSEFTYPHSIPSIPRTFGPPLVPRVYGAKYGWTYGTADGVSLFTNILFTNALNYIMNVDASYGGATHDAYIWRECDIKTHLECLQDETTYLLGDSGYPLREHMMTPIENAVEGSPEERYNILHKRAHSTVERIFGILKGQWRCLLAAQELHYCRVTVVKIILACCVLHNLCLRAGVNGPELSEDDLQAEVDRQMASQRAASFSTIDLQAGRRPRARLIQTLERDRR